MALSFVGTVQYGFAFLLDIVMLRNFNGVLVSGMNLWGNKFKPNLI